MREVEWVEDVVSGEVVFSAEYLADKAVPLMKEGN